MPAMVDPGNGDRERTCVVALLAGGTGTRFGADLPKQLLTVAGRTLLEHALRAFHAHPGVDAITLVMAPGHLDAAQTIVREGRYHDKVTAIVEGGATRSESTRAALATLPEEPCHVLVHDAARPLVTARIITDCLSALRTYPAVNVAIASTDTLVAVDESGVVVDFPARESLRRVQTPQGFRSEVLTEAYERAANDPNFSATDDCGVVARYLPDQPIAVVEGDERNLKVTTPVDLEIVAALLRDGSR
jgi:2-C-methyl-D-erythritol 4-phosphate cytidylyltransferase